MKKILITGGAGFIGSHLADELILRGYRVRLLDNLSPQVHGPLGRPPAYLNPEAELIIGDVLDTAALTYALQDVDAVFHLAAAVGIGQSMYEIEKYVSTNNLGTAVLLETLIHHPVKRLLVASSMSIYGEGLYVDVEGRQVNALERPLEMLKAGHWEPLDEAGRLLTPVPTPERKTPHLSSVYALSKFDQERLCLLIGRSYGIATTALRFFNVFGPRQSLSNPYTGVLAIFAARYLNGKPPLIFEDGLQQRDFVSVHDVAQGCVAALESEQAPGQVFNIGSGDVWTILEVADRLGRVLGQESLKPVICGKYRMGDIRHCFADISRARALLGYRPQVSLEDGLGEMAGWLQSQIAQDRLEEATMELAQRGLTV